MQVGRSDGRQLKSGARRKPVLSGWRRKNSVRDGGRGAPHRVASQAQEDSTSALRKPTIQEYLLSGLNKQRWASL